MKTLIVLTVVSLALVACGKNDKPADERAAAASAAEASRPVPPPLLEPAPIEDRTASAAAAGKTAASAARSPKGERPRVASTAAAARTDATHTVAKGDTLASIAKARNLRVADVARWNDVRDPRRLRIGQELRLTPP